MSKTKKQIIMDQILELCIKNNISIMVNMNIDINNQDVILSTNYENQNAMIYPVNKEVIIYNNPINIKLFPAPKNILKKLFFQES